MDNGKTTTIAGSLNARLPSTKVALFIIAVGAKVVPAIVSSATATTATTNSISIGDGAVLETDIMRLEP